MRDNGDGVNGVPKKEESGTLERLRALRQIRLGGRLFGRGGLVRGILLENVLQVILLNERIVVFKLFVA